MHRRPPRVPYFSYTGAHAYFLTFCTRSRYPAFLDPDAAGHVTAQLLRHARNQEFAVLAYCVMPDHVHVLIEGRTGNADARRFVHRWRQATGHWWSRVHPSGLWQEGYWDWILRPHEDPLRIAAYIVQNPVRAGLVARVEDYEWVGSSDYTVQQLVTAIQLKPGGRG